MAEVLRLTPPAVTTTPEPVTKPQKRTVDWESIERDYRTGLLTLREIGQLHKVSHVAVQKRAKAEGWTRDLKARIQAKAEELVTKDVVTKEVTKVTEREVVEANAQLQADVIREHRSNLRQSREIAQRLLDELKLTGDNRELLASLGEIITADDKGNKRHEAFMAALSLGERADTLKKLVDAVQRVVTLERTVFGIEAGQEQEAYEDRLRKLLEE